MNPKIFRMDNGSKSPWILRQDLEISHQTIAARAFGIWLQQGRPTGQDVPNWLQAEQELRQAAVSSSEVKREAVRLHLNRSGLRHAGLTSPAPITWEAELYEAAP